MTHRHALRPAVRLAVCAIAVLPAVGVPSGRAEPRPPEAQVKPIDAPPKPIATALEGLRGLDEEKRKVAATTLATSEDAEPYVRGYTYTQAGRADSLAEFVLDSLEVGRAKRNVKRSVDWAKEGRYDLLVDVCLHLPETTQVNQVGQAFFDFAEAMRPISPKLGGPEAKQALAHSMKLFVEQQETRWFHQKAGTLKTDWQAWGFVRARSCEVSARIRHNWLVLTREELKGTRLPNNEWENCYIFHNSDPSLVDMSWSLLVCDGDVEFASTPRSSTVIANGSIRSKHGIGSDTSCFFASGDIHAGSSVHKGLYLAGGNILGANEKAREGIEREKSGLKENPFGVRFFQTAEVGVELAVKDDAVTIAKLTPGSPLTKYGVQVGDVITRVNDKAAKTANDVRRELRYSVVLEAGIFHITRGDEKLTRVVYFKNGLEK